MDLVHQNDLPIDQPKFILGIHKDKSTFGRHGGAAFIQSQSIGFHQLVMVLAHQSLFQNLVPRNIFVMTLGGLGCRSYQGLRKRVGFP